MNSCGDPVPFLADHRMHNLPELRALMRFGDHTIETVPFEIRLSLTIVLLSFSLTNGVSPAAVRVHLNGVLSPACVNICHHTVNYDPCP